MRSCTRSKEPDGKRVLAASARTVSAASPCRAEIWAAMASSRGSMSSPGHPPAVAHPGAQLGQDAEHAAADVDYACAGRDADAVEQLVSVGREELGLGQQMADLGRAVA